MPSRVVEGAGDEDVPWRWSIPVILLRLIFKDLITWVQKYVP